MLTCTYQALEQIIEDDFIERCFEEMLEQEEMGMFDGTDAPVVDPVELMNNLNLGVQENVVAAQNVGYLEEDGAGDEGGEAGHSNEGGNHGSRNDGDHQEDEHTTDDNSEVSIWMVYDTQQDINKLQMIFLFGHSENHSIVIVS